MIYPHSFKMVSAGLLCLSLGACMTAPPAGPSLMAMPGKGISFEAFQRDDAYCQSAALNSVGGKSPAETGNQAGVAAAATGTAVGALAGAAIGSASAHAGAGAAIGAGAGLLAGSAIGASNAQMSASAAQAAYDRTYAQCMSAKGHSISAPPVTYVYESDPVYVYSRPYYPWRHRYYYGW